jgi:hypothetical protein
VLILLVTPPTTCESLVLEGKDEKRRASSVALEQLDKQEVGHSFGDKDLST